MPRMGGVLILAAIAAAMAGWPAGADAAASLGDRYLDQVFAGVKRTDAIEYGSAINAKGERESLLLDLYQPADDLEDDRPVLIFAHGGAYTKGYRWSVHDWPVADDFARRGFVSASIDYRLDGSQAPAADDFRASVRWFKAHAQELRIDPHRIAVMGSSSGALMAMEVAFEPEAPGDSGNPGYPSDVAAGISIGGFQGQPSKIDPTDPPVAMMHALDDRTIPYATAQETCTQTQAMSNVCEMFQYQSGGHPPGFVIANRPLIVEQASGFLCRNVLTAAECGPFVERVAPATTDNVPAWSPGPVGVTLQARDWGGSGVDKTYFTKGADPPAPTRSSATYDPSAPPTLRDGERIRYFSTDRYGNAEGVRTSRVARVDASAPTSRATAARVAGSGIEVDYQATDAGSGVTRVELYVRRPGAEEYVKVGTASAASGRFSYAPSGGPGTYDFWTLAYDAAGNDEDFPSAPDASVRVPATG